jgi:5'-deoxynucleotidase YfbR-like HD superfamily hydrolase
MAGLSHDLGEQVIGDIPSPTKRLIGDLGMRALNDLEDQTLSETGLLFSLTEEEQNLLKLADCLDGMLFCISERRLGNRNVVEIFGRFCSYARQLGVKSDLFEQIVCTWRESDERQ